MGMKEKFSNFFFLDDEEPISGEPQPSQTVKTTPTPKFTKQSNQETGKFEQDIKSQSGGLNVVSIKQQNDAKKPKITLVEPRLYSEVKDVADLILSNQSVILNFRRMEKEQARQMIDFLMGATYAIKGDIQRIGDQIFVCTPESVEIDGKELNAMKGHEF